MAYDYPREPNPELQKLIDALGIPQPVFTEELHRYVKERLADGERRLAARLAREAERERSAS